MNPTKLTNVNDPIVESLQNEEMFDIPLNLSDILSICKEYSKLGYNMQHQIDSILDIGIEESILYNIVSKESLVHIKNFLEQIIDNVYFGAAIDEAAATLMVIEDFESKNPGFASQIN